MAYRRKLTQSFFIILSIQALLSVGLTYFTISGLLRSQNRTILEEGWNQQEAKFNNIFKQINKDLYFYKYLIEDEMQAPPVPERIESLLQKCLANTVAHTAGLYSAKGDLLYSKTESGDLNQFTIQKSPYSLFDFRYPSTKISWSQNEAEFNYFGLISGTRIISSDDIFYLVFFTDFEQHFQQISERQPEVLSVFSLENRILYSDFPGVKPFNLSERGWTEIELGNDTFLVFGNPVWSKEDSVVTLSVMHSITAEKAVMNKLIRTTVIVFSFSWVVAFIIALWVSRIFSVPLVKLNNSLKTYLDEGFFPVIKYSGEDDLAFLISTFQNLTEKVLQEEQHIRSQIEEIQLLNEYNENLLESIQSGIMVVDSSGRIEFCNSFFLQTLSPLISEDIRDREYKFVLKDLINREVPDLDELVQLRFIPGIQLPSGSLANKQFSLKISPVYRKGKLEKVLLILEDTTEVDRIWEESLLVDRISSLSLLSAGMGHEINNPLATIQSHIDYLSTIENNSEKKDSINWIKDGISRISSIVADTSQYTRSSDLSITESCVQTAQETARLIMSSKQKKDINIVIEAEPLLPAVRIPEDLFKQLLLNLLLNALDASEPGSLIKVILSLSTKHDIVTVNVMDSGKGIPQDLLPKVFNPFFSFGKGSRGTGLGLSVCYGIVSRAGGRIAIESEEGQGTVVTVELNCYENIDS